MYGFVGNDGVDWVDYIGLLVPGATAPIVVPWDQLDGDTQGKWQIEPTMHSFLWLFKPYWVTVTGQLKLTVSLDPRTQNEISPLSIVRDVTVKQHEYHHVKIWTDNWEAARAAINPLEGKYCHRPCAVLAMKLINFYSVYFQWKVNLENNQYDWDQYARKDPGRKKQYKENIEKAKVNVNNYAKDVNSLVDKWIAERCPR